MNHEFDFESGETRVRLRARLVAPDGANAMRVVRLKSPAPFLADAYVAEIGDTHFDQWAQEGYSKDNGYDFNVLLDALKYNAYVSSSKITRPCLITHGDADQIVSV